MDAVENNAENEEKINQESLSFGPRINTIYYIDTDTLKISILGDFTFNLQGYFRECCDHYIKRDISNIIIDLKECSYIDSAALGMILILQEDTKAINPSISIVTALPEIKKLLVTTRMSAFGIKIV